MKSGFTYILSNKLNTVLYIGVTSDLIHRIQEHKSKQTKGFTQKYSVTKLVYYEEYESIVEAIEREKQLKKWKRKWKDELIMKENLFFRDLSEEFLD